MSGGLTNRRTPSKKKPGVRQRMRGLQGIAQHNANLAQANGKKLSEASHWIAALAVTIHGLKERFPGLEEEVIWKWADWFVNAGNYTKEQIGELQGVVAKLPIEKLRVVEKPKPEVTPESKPRARFTRNRDGNNQNVQGGGLPQIGSGGHPSGEHRASKDQS